MGRTDPVVLKTVVAVREYQHEVEVIGHPRTGVALVLPRRAEAR